MARDFQNRLCSAFEGYLISGGEGFLLVSCNFVLVGVGWCDQGLVFMNPLLRIYPNDGNTNGGGMVASRGVVGYVYFGGSCS